MDHHLEETFACAMPTLHRDRHEIIQFSFASLAEGLHVGGAGAEGMVTGADAEGQALPKRMKIELN